MKTSKVVKKSLIILFIAVFILLSVSCRNELIISIIGFGDGPGEDPVYNITISLVNNQDGDTVTASASSGHAGDIITLNYAIAEIEENYSLVFSGTQSVIPKVESPSDTRSGTRQYTINASDAQNGVITITATFTHTDIKQIQLEITGAEVVLTKPYDGNNTALVNNPGTLQGIIEGDTVTVTAAATYNSPNVLEANSITVVFTLGGADAGNYIKPENLTITEGVSITRADGAAVNAPTADPANITYNSITANAVTAPSNGQTVEYAIAASSTAPATGWQDGLAFSGLNPDTDYWIFARSKQNDNFNAGAVQSSEQLKTLEAPEETESLDFGFVITNNVSFEEISFENAENLPGIKAGEENLSITVSGEYESYVWIINGETSAETSGTLTVNAVDYTVGEHQVLVIVFKAGSPVPLSQKIYFTVVE